MTIPAPKQQPKQEASQLAFTGCSVCVRPCALTFHPQHSCEAAVVILIYRRGN